MPEPPGRRQPVAVEFDADVWSEEVGRFAPRSSARSAAEAARRTLERAGVPRDVVRRCDPEADDGTRLAGCLKLKVPLDREASRAEFGFVFELVVHRDGRPALRMLSFGERHPPPGVRSVYERAHKRLHGKYPDQ